MGLYTSGYYQQFMEANKFYGNNNLLNDSQKRYQFTCIRHIHMRPCNSFIDNIYI